MRLQLEPLDTLFFRDGTPFSGESTGPKEVGGLFPPHPASITGALRAALARANGWTGSGRWPAELNAAFGPGPDDLGLLSFTGPVLLRQGEPLFPVPLHLQGASEGGGWNPRALLRPGPPVACDLGPAVRLPELPAEIQGPERAELKEGEGWWLTLPGLERVLRGELPPSGALVAGGDLWKEERRIGIERDRSSRTAVDGMLYTTRHVRLAPGVSLGVEIALAPSDRNWNAPSGVLPLGGESRQAACSPWTQPFTLTAPQAAIDGSGRLLVIALTPLDLDADQALGRRPLADLGDARVVSACLGRPLRIGGWDSLARRPLDLQSFLPAGSVLFCELPDPGRLADTLAAGGGLARLGARQRWGYGLVALGTWTGTPA
ncbi:type III-B CRISPR module-associated Cmr3 family protein [Aphanothece minutissima]|uniref:Type III-B CRISPR module-associated protein Cmr3 n=1 Tax=Aphanothece cf. minutissima CCALA 015 TaxID=2107695 RepID=A0ABX5FBZ9_9CHRO|nr:type III-B CRISPR module-associated Cmr3 family protein [Aphanothece minutissima]PSB39443.1 type III-B CRISPR module-associated protein Cmr3 [Aphanothece cf. minutissima CCALA 015]